MLSLCAMRRATKVRFKHREVSSFSGLTNLFSKTAQYFHQLCIISLRSLGVDETPKQSQTCFTLGLFCKIWVPLTHFISAKAKFWSPPRPYLSTVQWEWNDIQVYIHSGSFPACSDRRRSAGTPVHSDTHQCLTKRGTKKVICWQKKWISKLIHLKPSSITFSRASVECRPYLRKSAACHCRWSQWDTRT